MWVATALSPRSTDPCDDRQLRDQRAGKVLLDARSPESSHEDRILGIPPPLVEMERP